MAPMLRSHLERWLAECVELKIWASSESSPGFGRAHCDSHIHGVPCIYLHDPSPNELWWTLDSWQPNALPICLISGWPRAVHAISLARHLSDGAGPGWMHVPQESTFFWMGFGRGAREFQNRWKSSQLFKPPASAMRTERFWQSFHRFLQDTHH